MKLISTFSQCSKPTHILQAMTDTSFRWDTPAFVGEVQPSSFSEKKVPNADEKTFDCKEDNFKYETVHIRTRFVNQLLEVSADSARKLPELWKKVLHSNHRDKEIYIDADPNSLNWVFEYLSGYLPSVPSRAMPLYQKLMGTPVDYKAMEDKINTMAKTIKVAIHSAVALLEQVPRRVELNIEVPDEIKQLDLNRRNFLRQAIDLANMVLTTKNGYTFPKSPRTIHLRGQCQVVLRGPPPSKEKSARQPHAPRLERSTGGSLPSSVPGGISHYNI